MDVSQCDARIDSLQQCLQQLRDEMEQASLEFLDATEEFLASWYEQRARLDVASYPDRARELGRSGLKKLKRKVRALQKQVPQLVDEILDRDRLWTHRRPVEELSNGFSPARYATYGDEGAAELKEPIISLASQLGPVLAESGILRFGYPWVRQGTAVRLGLAPRWSSRMQKAIAQYRELNTEFLERVRELVETRRLRNEAEILCLWDEV